MKIRCNVSSLYNQKVLLAFSAGIDSSALFFLLLEENIPFDIALVNYQTRENSDVEEAHAKKLAQNCGLKCFSIKAPTFETHFEEQARKFRYEFFEKIIEEEGYSVLLTAHQLNDQLEWLLMRLTKGAGVSELVGLETVSQRNGYQIVRPLLEYSKETLLSYLKEHQYPYFVDESNSNERYERNRFRAQFSDRLLSEYGEGIQRSLGYLRQDKALLASGYEVICTVKALRVVRLYTMESKVRASDQILKSLGYLLSASQRTEISNESSLVIGGKWAVELQDSLLYIAPYEKVEMPKAFKEKCRLLKIPVKIRPYLLTTGIDPNSVPNS